MQPHEAEHTAQSIAQGNGGHAIPCAQWHVDQKLGMSPFVGPS
jgi:hypothetical protein